LKKNFRVIYYLVNDVRNVLLSYLYEALMRFSMADMVRFFMASSSFL